MTVTACIIAMCTLSKHTSGGNSPMPLDNSSQGMNQSHVVIICKSLRSGGDYGNHVNSSMFSDDKALTAFFSCQLLYNAKTL